jgi:hypothetical protein
MNSVHAFPNARMIATPYRNPTREMLSSILRSLAILLVTNRILRANQVTRQAFHRDSRRSQQRRLRRRPLVEHFPMSHRSAPVPDP